MLAGSSDWVIPLGSTESSFIALVGNFAEHWLVLGVSPVPRLDREVELGLGRRDRHGRHFGMISKLGYLPYFMGMTRRSV